MQYRVANPRNIPSGIRVMLTVDATGKAHDWFEDDLFQPPDNLSDEEMEELVAKGFLEEVSG